MLKITICVIGISMGLIISLTLICVGKFKKYMALKKKNGNLWIKLLDSVWRILLPLMFAFFSIILPIIVLCFFITDAIIIKSLGSIYFYSFVPSFFICMFLLIKIGKIKTTKRLQ